MANQGVKGQTFAPLLFLQYFCTRVRQGDCGDRYRSAKSTKQLLSPLSPPQQVVSGTPLVANAVVHQTCDMQQKHKKMQNNLCILNFCCIFATSLNERRPTPADVEYILNNLTHLLDSQKYRKFQNHINWHMLVYVWCPTFAVFLIRAMREPL